MKNNNEKNCLLNKMSNACLKNDKVYGNFKVSILICAILFAVATVFYLCFGLNFSKELATRYVISVDFKDTISSVTCLYESFIAYGKCELIDDRQESLKALQLLRAWTFLYIIIIQRLPKILLLFIFFFTTIYNFF